MQLHNTVLALQVMNGVQVYAVQFLNDRPGKDTDTDAATWGKPRLSTKRYHYKSADVLDLGTWVLVPTSNGTRFGIARVEENATDEIDYDSDIKLLWINQVIEPPHEVFEVHAGYDAGARRKLAASQAQKAAQEHLNALGVDASAFAIESKEEGSSDA